MRCSTHGRWRSSEPATTRPSGGTSSPAAPWSRPARARSRWSTGAAPRCSGGRRTPRSATARDGDRAGPRPRRRLRPGGRAGGDRDRGGRGRRPGGGGDHGRARRAGCRRGEARGRGGRGRARRGSGAGGPELPGHRRHRRRAAAEPRAAAGRLGDGAQPERQPRARPGRAAGRARAGHRPVRLRGQPGRRHRRGPDAGERGPRRHPRGGGLRRGRRGRARVRGSGALAGPGRASRWCCSRPDARPRPCAARSRTPAR